jgi:tetratricopeptide (TPR) repeat protein
VSASTCWLVSREEADRDDLITIAIRSGYRPILARPRGARDLALAFELGEDQVLHYVEVQAKGARVLLAENCDLPEAIGSWAGAIDLDAAIARAERAVDVAGRIRAMMAADAMVASRWDDRLAAVVRRALEDLDPALHRAAAWLASAAQTDAADAILAAVAERGAEDPRGAVAQRVADFRGRAARGELTGDIDGEQDEEHLRALLADAEQRGQHVRAEAAASALLANVPYNDTDPHAFAVRARARRGRGRFWTALVDALIARGLARDAVQLAKDGDYEAPAAPDGIDALVEELRIACAGAAGVFDPALLASLDALGQRGRRETCIDVLRALDALPTGHEDEVAMYLALAAHDLGEYRGSRADHDVAYEAARRVLARHPACTQAWSVVARSAPKDGEETLDAVDRTLDGMDEPPADAFEARAREIAATFSGRELRRDRLERIRLSALQKLGRHEEAAASARKALEGKEDDVLAWLDHAVMLTNAKRHQEAIEAYTRAIALFERGVLIIGDITAMWFNRACERAFTGDLEGGLSDLAEAVRRSDKWRGAARTDDYFDSIRESPAHAAIFERILEGDLSTAPPYVKASQEGLPPARDEVRGDTGGDDPDDRAEHASEPPAVAAVRRTFERITEALRRARDRGIAETAIGAAIHDAIRGAAPPPALARIDGVAEAIAEVARQATAPNMLIVAAMSIDLLSQGVTTLDRTLDDLTHIAIGHAFERAG